jgi:hypothetical protein
MASFASRRGRARHAPEDFSLQGVEPKIKLLHSQLLYSYAAEERSAQQSKADATAAAADFDISSI